MHIHPPRDKMEATLLTDVQICQEQGDQHTDMCHPPLYLGLLGSGTQDQHIATSVKYWGHITPLLIKNAQENTFEEKLLFYVRQDSRAEKVETKSIISENKLWDAFHHNCD